MSDHTAALAAAAARAAYANAGHCEAGLLTLAPIPGPDAPNVIDLDAVRASRKRTDDTPAQ
jgi:UDP-N-acetylglucosamine 2-epimerase